MGCLLQISIRMPYVNFGNEYGQRHNNYSSVFFIRKKGVDSMKNWARSILCITIAAICCFAFISLRFYFRSPEYNELYSEEFLSARGFHSIQAVTKKCGKEDLLHLENAPAAKWDDESFYILSFPKGSPSQPTDLYMHYNGTYPGYQGSIVVNVNANFQRKDGLSALALFRCDDIAAESEYIYDTPVSYCQYNFNGDHYLEGAAFEYNDVFYRVSASVPGEEALLDFCEALLRSQLD